MTAIRNPSFAKNNIRVLLLEGISDTAEQAFRDQGFTRVDRMSKALDGRELIDELATTRILGIRSRTQITAEVVAATDRLIALGCFSVGTNQVDLDAANAKGIPVFNAPFSNTRSVAELTIAEIVMLFRQVFPKSVSAHAGGWDKNANGAHEVRGKTLGIVG
ncbi:MAG: phosphoglycerate dehydrogenase, partial [Hyphomicrobium sp.]